MTGFVNQMDWGCCAIGCVYKAFSFIVYACEVPTLYNVRISRIHAAQMNMVRLAKLYVNKFPLLHILQLTR